MLLKGVTLEHIKIIHIQYSLSWSLATWQNKETIRLPSVYMMSVFGILKYSIYFAACLESKIIKSNKIANDIKLGIKP